jgi:YD repeat-containing protein
VTSYAYYTAADQATHPNTRGLLKQVTLPAVGGVTATRTFDYDAYGNLDTYTDEENSVSTWEVDALDRLTKETLPDVDTGDAIAAPYRAYTYDKLNRRKTERDEEANISSYVYSYVSGGGLKVTVTDPARDGASQPTVSEYHFDAVGSLIKVVDPLDRETSYNYDFARRLQNVVYPDPDQTPGGANGPLASPVTSYNYDRAGRLLGTVESTDGSELNPADYSGHAPTIESGAVTQWNVSTAVGASEIDLSSIFQDDYDADNALRYAIVSNTVASFFDALSITSTNPRKLLLDFKGNSTGTSIVTVRATDTSGLKLDHAITVVRTQAQNEQEFRVNSSATNTQIRPAVAARGGIDGGFVVAWEETATPVVKARLFDDNGSTFGSEITVTPSTTSKERWPRMESSSSPIGGSTKQIRPSCYFGVSKPMGMRLAARWRSMTPIRLASI